MGNATIAPAAINNSNRPRDAVVNVCWVEMAGMREAQIPNRAPFIANIAETARHGVRLKRWRRAGKAGLVSDVLNIYSKAGIDAGIIGVGIGDDGVNLLTGQGFVASAGIELFRVGQ